MFNAPFYDCDDRWIIDIQPEVFCESGSGCTNYRTHVLYLRQDLLYPGSDILWHELKHLKCWNYYDPKYCLGHFDHPKNWDKWH